MTQTEQTACAVRPQPGQEDPASEIPRRPAGLADVPLSDEQEQLYRAGGLAPGQPADSIPVALRLTGPLLASALSRAVDRLVARHEILRTRLAAGTDGQPAQVVEPAGRVQLELVDLSAVEPDRRQAAAAEFIAAAAGRPPGLADRPLLRSWLVRLAGDEHVLLLVTPRVIFDEWSAGVVVRDLAAWYQAEASGRPPGLDELPVQFADYAVWQRRQPPAVLAGLEEYWLAALAGCEVSQFPADRTRPEPGQESRSESIQASLELLDGLRELSAREGTTLPVTLLAALHALLSRYTGLTDVMVGATDANRARPELAGLVGPLARTMPVRASWSADPAFTDLLGLVRDAAAGSRAHQDLPLARLAEIVHPGQDPGRSPVFQVTLACPEPVGDIESAGVLFHRERIWAPGPASGIGFVAQPQPDGLWLQCTYPPAAFDGQTVRRLLGHFEVLLRGVVADPSARLSRLPLLTAEELHRELAAWNDTAAAFPAMCIHQGFEAQVARAPHAVAAQLDGQRLTYAQLNAQANQIARRLRQLAVGPEVLAGVCLGPSLHRLAAVLGILKAGGGYVPLDPELPPARLSFMIADTEMPVVLTDGLTAPKVPACDGVAVLSLDAERAQIAALAEANLDGTGAEPSNAAYVIYTSGSTGQPKGVVVEHRQAVNFLHGVIGQWQVNESDVVLQFASLSFDVSVLDMFLPLLAGARMVLVPPEARRSPPRLAALIGSAGVTFTCLTPSVLSVLPTGDYPELRVLMTAGEELPSEVARRWVRPGQHQVNAYGPTETIVLATYQELDGSVYPPPLGRPLPNYRVYVLDRFGNPVPVGVTGELHVGGVGVARGYLNRPELTRERFIPDPFSGEPGARLYKTGDLGRRWPDGTIAFAGRADDQVKIRGLRIELGEIEAALAAQPEVAQAVVTVMTDASGEKQLAGYLRAEPGHPLQVADIRRRLAGFLPAYMIPPLVTVDEFPLTGNGKINKAALPAPPAPAPAQRVPPRTMLEAVLVSLYTSVLGGRQVSATDSFFDVGGSSLQAMQLVTRLGPALAVDLDVSAVFQAPTPQQLAALLRDKHDFDDPELDEEGIEIPGERTQAQAC